MKVWLLCIHPWFSPNHSVVIGSGDKLSCTIDCMTMFLDMVLICVYLQLQWLHSGGWWTQLLWLYSGIRGVSAVGNLTDKVCNNDDHAHWFWLQVAAWLAAAVLLLLFVIYVVLMVAYCRHIRHWRSPKYSHFPEETVQSQNHFDYGTTKSTNPFDWYGRWVYMFCH